ncbi:MAG: MerR family transcriptional regulator [Lachnospiraceae bacterium]|nr:MerR family transcriptional regulator [Lachnospiraceae bacterium]
MSNMQKNMKKSSQNDPENTPWNDTGSDPRNGPDDKKLFTVAEVAHSCGISRTSLIRLEESGFLRPAHVNPATGYRYYDVRNIVEIGRYKRLQAIGLTRKEMADYYRGHIDPEQFIEEQRKKLNELQHFINEFELRYTEKKLLDTFMVLPDMICYCEDISSSSFKEAEALAYATYKKVVVKGLRVLPDQPPLIISDNWEDLDKDSPSGCNLTVCIPVKEPLEQDRDPYLRAFPSHEALSVCGAGRYSILTDLISKLHSLLHERGLKSDGPARVIILATHVTTPDEYIFECILPIKK